MLIVAIDESEKAALVKSRRILSKYLFQHGHATYAGYLSKEGLDYLNNELRIVASKNSAIGLFVTGRSKGLELFDTVGKVSKFSPEGFYVHKTHVIKKLKEQQPGFTATQRLIRLIIRLAALFHDIGKLCIQFQRKLRSFVLVQERIRHELLSYLILSNWKTDHDEINDSVNWIEVLINSTNPLSTCVNVNGTANIDKNLSDTFSTCASDVLSMHIDIQELSNSSTKNLLSNTNDPIWNAMMWLVLSHHKLVGSKTIDGNAPDLVRAQINPNDWNDENLKLAKNGLPWDDDSWCEQVRACATQIQRILTDNPGIVDRMTANPAAWTATLATACRPYLIFSDYTGSLLKESTQRPVVKDVSIAYANTIQVNGVDYLADTVPTHLKKVRKAVDPIFSLCELSGKSQLPCINSNQIPEESTLRTVIKKGTPYYWQYAASQALQEKVVDIENKPGFIVLSSGTGSGKTIGGVRLLYIASGGYLRFTAALGLRSLTLQVGDAYTNQNSMKLPSDEVMTVVGDTLYAQLNKTNRSIDSGSENMDADDDCVLKGGREDYKNGGYLGKTLGLKNTEITSLLSTSKVVGMIQVPVLVCTVDHLMKASTAQGGGDTRMMLRLATSDLLLDEVDNYSTEDMVCLGRLVHAAGVHGRRVVIMSATISETAIIALHHAWLQGLASYEMRHEKSSEHYLCLVSDKTEPVIVNKPSIEFASETVKSFITTLIEATPAQEQKNIGSTFSIEKENNTDKSNRIKEAFECIKDKAFELKNYHFTVDSSGRELSMGVVRFNQVRNAREFAQYLHAMEMPSDVNIKIVCYHRRIPLYLLTLIERSLNKLLDRKDPDKIFSEKLIKEWMDNEPVKKKFLLIVCATSIQETGRDHDYDWGITEPWSTRSAIQLAGRILRHRRNRAGMANVWITNIPLSMLREGSQKNMELSYSSKNGPLELIPSIISSPGKFEIECKSSKPKGFGQKPSKSRIMMALESLGTLESTQVKSLVFEGSEAFDLEQWNQGIVTHHCLRATPASKASITCLEHAMQYGRLMSNEKWSLYKIVTNPEAPLYNSHHSAIRFRRSDGNQIKLTMDPYHNFKKLCMVQQDRMGIELIQASLIHEKLENPDRALIRLDLANPYTDESVPDRAKNNPNSLDAKLLFSFESYGDVSEVLSGMPIIGYHPLLGADRIRKDKK